MKFLPLKISFVVDENNFFGKGVTNEMASREKIINQYSKFFNAFLSK